MHHVKKLVVTTGEPAGIGPDVTLIAATRAWDDHLVAIGDKDLLHSRARQLNLELELIAYDSGDAATSHRPGVLPVIHLPLKAVCEPGQLNPENAGYVLAQLDAAVSLCTAGECHAMVTAPVHKANISDAGISFTGHTEYLQAVTQALDSLMLLQNDALRVALATTHMPLRQVPQSITRTLISQKLDTLIGGLSRYLPSTHPRITVLGLNPHAGEAGHIGEEELAVLTPVCDEYRRRGHCVVGPISADTAFLSSTRAQTDAYLAMYHDQALPVIKTLGFGDTVNLTLGLPIVRTSVDHGTALELAATGSADAGSLCAAIRAASHMAAQSGNTRDC